MSTLVIDTIQGKTTAGSVNVRGEGSNNTNLQQGLAKVWVFTTDNVITDSFNTSSSTDNGVGHYTITLSSAMSDANFAVVATVNENNNYILGNRERDANSYGLRIKDDGGTQQDANTGSVAHGDLA